MDKPASAPAQTLDAPLQLGLSRSLSTPPSASQTAALAGSVEQAVPTPAPGLFAPKGPEIDPVYAAIFAGAILVAGLVLKLKKQKQADQESVIWAVEQGDLNSAVIPVVKRSVAADEEKPNALTPESSTKTLGKPRVTVYDLQQLASQLRGLLRERNDAACWSLLTAHIERSERTSPWVYLELYQVARRLSKEQDWKVLRLKFRQQFGQAAPAWGSNLSYTGIPSDPLLSAELTKLWPSSSTRSWIERWMLGTGADAGKGPPLLSIAIYRDMLWLDNFLAQLLRQASSKHRERLGGV